MKRIFTLLLLVPALALGHIMSMSQGSLRLEGKQAFYELQMPIYEITHLDDPEKALLDNIRFFDGGREVRRTSGSCVADEPMGAYRCEASYEFPAPPDEIEVECTFAAVTVPNHVHILRATRGAVTDQAVFDFSFSRARLRFTEPSTLERAWSQFSAGGLRVVTGPFQMLFVLAVVLAGRKREELWSLAVAFLAAQTISALVVSATAWQPPARFTEAAAALTVAYLAVEILILPDAGFRWAVAAAMGVFHGFYFGSFLQQTGMDWTYVLTGVALADALLLVVFALLLGQAKRRTPWLRPVQAGAVVLFLIGMAWFIFRVRS